MSTVYVVGSVGPWYADDSAVVCDGVVVNGSLRAGPPSVDGSRATGAKEWNDTTGLAIAQAARDTGKVRSE